MRNPHLSWDAGYYEAHITVPGKVNFYGDFRIARSRSRLAFDALWAEIESQLETGSREPLE